jgi:crotonobetainyl-CoA dehydrogenase
MDFTLTDEQQLLLESLDDLIARECTPDYVARLDREHRQPVEFRKAMHEAGFLTLGYPEEYGGTPCEALTLFLVAERVAAAGLNIGYGTEVLTVLDILEFGSEEQKKQVLGILGEGGVPFALGFTEPGAGSDSSAMKMTAVHADGKVTLNGTKTLITNAVDAAYLLTMAKNPDAADPRHAISMYLVPTDTPGITMSPIDKIVWLRAAHEELRTGADHDLHPVLGAG